MKILNQFIIAGLTGFAALQADAQTRSAAPAVTPAGKAIYARECVACHGVKGDGEGPGAHIVNPAPRDFTLNVFKFRTTPSGQPPTDDDLFKIITNGVVGTAMPSFRELPDSERWSLVAIVKQFAAIGVRAKPIAIPPEPQATAALLQQGKMVYGALKCANCHGAEGQGDGPSALTLKDDAKQRIWAPNLTAGAFKSGRDPKALYARIATGLDGTPMPSYAAEAKPDEIWSLVHYIQSLSTTPAKGKRN
jgi:cytochrome c oxidase cbb3-type subunit 2